MVRKRLGRECRRVHFQAPGLVKESWKVWACGSSACQVHSDLGVCCSKWKMMLVPRLMKCPAHRDLTVRKPDSLALTEALPEWLKQQG